MQKASCFALRIKKKFQQSAKKRKLHVCIRGRWLNLSSFISNWPHNDFELAPILHALNLLLQSVSNQQYCALSSQRNMQ